MTPLEQKICDLASPERSASEIAQTIGCDRSTVHTTAKKYGLALRMRKRPQKRDSLIDSILNMNDGKVRSSDIAAELGCSARYVQNVLRNHHCERLPRGAMHGHMNPSYIAGRSIDLDGYALVAAPCDHPYARSSGRMFEHRLVAERKLGRYLLPSEVVDHIDGLHLHNAPENLRVFCSNADHLRATIAGNVPNWSQEGLARLRAPRHLLPEIPRVDSYRQHRERGDVRLQQILLAALQLGTDSPHLLGTHHLLEKAGIDWTQRTMIERALADLSQQ